MLAKTLVLEEMCRSFIGFSPHGFMLPPDAPNLYYLHSCCVNGQREKYFQPYVDDKLDSAMACTEPGAGSDVSGLKTTAVKKGDKWIRPLFVVAVVVMTIKVSGLWDLLSRMLWE